MKLLRLLLYSLLGIALLPAVYGGFHLLFRQLVALQLHPAHSHTLLRFLLGGLLQFLAFCFLPRPVRLYVLAHELSHALAALTSGKRVRGIAVHRHGGHVEVSESSLWIALAPYMLPFYSLLLLLGTLLAGLWLNLTHWLPWLPLLLGITWSHHLCFTALTLSLGQSDLDDMGPLCAYPLILLGNLAFLLPALLWLSETPLTTWPALTAAHLAAPYRALWRFFRPF